MFNKIGAHLKKYRRIINIKLSKRDSVDNFILSGFVWVILLKATTFAMERVSYR